MAQLYTEYNGVEFLQPLVAEISWAKHIVILSKCKDNQQRQFYIMATKKYNHLLPNTKEIRDKLGSLLNSLAAPIPHSILT